ncbi:TolC family protein [Catenovulum adriaticum]|uniref:TolC family protein n=1 Tax=Catenovulum adriaticum TaxID=2984846 RepID=A0ABY7AQS1_9ALTE|nr:TolC family protein [Catenovulum sp. TS8]WAJ71481.1 TolC family protein [Catenovulum sp. TS8]
MLNQHSNQHKIPAPERWTYLTQPHYQPENTSLADNNSLIVLPNELKELIQQALVANQELAIAIARFSVSAADLDMSNAKQLPTLNASLNSSRSQRLTGVNSNIQDKSINNSFTGALRFNWELDLWQRLADQVKASESDFYASEQDLLNVKQSIISQVVATYLALAENHKLIENTQANYNSQRQRVEITEYRLDKGLADSLDLRLAKNNLFSIQANLAQQELNYAKAEQKMNVLLGRYPGTKLNLKLDSVELATFKLTISPTQVLTHRPDIRAAEARVASAFSRWKSADKNNLPKINLTANFRGSREEIAQLLDWQYWLASIAVDLTQPIFDGGAIDADIAQKSARQQWAWAQYQKSILNAWQEIEQNLAAEYALTKRHKALEQAYLQIAASESLLINQYEQGLIKSFDLLSIQTRRMNTEMNKIRAQYAVLNNRVGLMLALGQPFSVDQNINAANEQNERQN